MICRLSTSPVAATKLLPLLVLVLLVLVVGRTELAKTLLPNEQKIKSPRGNGTFVHTYTHPRYTKLIDFSICSAPGATNHLRTPNSSRIPPTHNYVPVVPTIQAAGAPTPVMRWNTEHQPHGMQAPPGHDNPAAPLTSARPPLTAPRGRPRRGRPRSAGS